MKDDNTWLLILLAAGVALYFLLTRSTASSGVVYNAQGQATSAGIPVTAQNPLAMTNVNPAIAPATANVLVYANPNSPDIPSVISPMTSDAPYMDVPAGTFADNLGAEVQKPAGAIQHLLVN